MRDKKYTTDQCPACRVTFEGVIEQLLPNVRLGQEFTCVTLGCCQSCGHALCLYLSRDRRHVEACVPPHDWLHENFSSVALKEVHEGQEGIHHKLGHWG